MSSDVNLEAKKLAAEVIQRAWRRHIDVQVYRYYRDLITFKNQGDPAMMLRCINPVEASLLDAASGTFVRFRLAGEKFPPNIYYKVFTKRPVVDMCANSPKNYAQQKSLKLPAREQNNRTKFTENASQPTKEGWYRRYENNGWRLIADRMIHNAATDITTLESSQKVYQRPHPNGLMKINDVKRRRKQKKLQWLKKLYEQKMLKFHGDEDEVKNAMMMNAAEEMIDAARQSSYDCLDGEIYEIDKFEDEDVDELLGWTNALNFDDYLEDWKNVASTASEVDFIEEHKIAVLAEPCEFTVRRENKVHDVQKAYVGHHHAPRNRNLNSNVQN